MNKEIRAIIIGVFSALAAFGVLQWMGSNVAFQMGGSNNKIDQKIEPRNQSPSTEIHSSRSASKDTARESSPSNAQIEQHLKKIEEQLKSQKTEVIVKVESSCKCDAETNTDSEDEDEIEDPAGE